MMMCEHKATEFYISVFSTEALIIKLMLVVFMVNVKPSHKHNWVSVSPTVSVPLCDSGLSRLLLTSAWLSLENA